MLMGDVIARLEDETFAAETLVGLDDLGLLARVEAAAAEEGLDLGSYAARCVRVFEARASDEDWVGLMGRLGRTDDPGREALRTMLQAALAPPVEGGSCGHHHGAHR
jgi:hypothetical protein